ncbi:hypothetical protein [Metaclostridioides mangenotii]|uniref:NADH dehydrogenase subunit 5 n=1 Tax=Metaclostridioides mangenotii TaxID=1540 RepID=A0ABS4E737_9FIRM|nr:hypothetical protein [Clostridioides mangenotii]MBP1853733.1 hypothetical protein [Clostridioides mangenotii]
MFSRNDIISIMLPIIATIIASYLSAKKKRSLGYGLVFGIITLVVSSFIYYILYVE